MLSDGLGRCLNVMEGIALTTYIILRLCELLLKMTKSFFKSIYTNIGSENLVQLIGRPLI